MKFRILALIPIFTLIACSTKPTETSAVAPTPTPYKSPVSSLPSKVEAIPIPNTDIILKKGSGEALRGNAPRNLEDLQTLKKYGVTEVIIFKNDRRGEVKNEMAQLKDLGYSDSQIHYINFDWADNGDFKSACLKFVEANRIMDETIAKNEKSFIHCTTGEDRTGAASAVYQLTHDKKLKIADVFKNEMCAKGFEAGDKQKPQDIVNKIREGLSKTFLKMAYAVQWAHKNKKPVNAALCENDPSDKKEFLKSEYAKTEKFYCL